MEKLKVTIAGETYNLTTEDDVEEMLRISEEVDKKINGIVRKSGRISVTQAAVLTALEYGEAYIKSEATCENLRVQIQAYLEDAARARTNAELARREVERLKKEIEALK
ncbi:MAG: cell division protein ZapA [Clostridia bacterium]|nr:cell division protein ZapA [Clostridia bacterium]